MHYVCTSAATTLQVIQAVPVSPIGTSKKTKANTFVVHRIVAGGKEACTPSANPT